MIDDQTIRTAIRLVEDLSARGVTIATAESCTGGLIAATITAVAGASAVLDRGFVTYSNRAKHEMLNVDMAMLERHGAVSAEVAEAMAEGARAASGAQIAIAVTGIAGPHGGTPEKPVGLVWFGLAGNATGSSHSCIFDGDRTMVRAKTVRHALALIRTLAAV